MAVDETAARPADRGEPGSRAEGAAEPDGAAEPAWRPFRVLMVCTANQARSAMAERMLRRDLGPLAGPGRIEVRGAGTRTVDGLPMEPPAAAELAHRGIDASDFASRALTDRLVSLSDLILTATRGHRSTVLERVPLALKRTFTLREFAALVAEVDAGVDAGGASAHGAPTPGLSAPGLPAPGGPRPESRASRALGPEASEDLRALVRFAADHRGAASLGDDEYDVADPAGHADDYYRHAARLIERATAVIAWALAFAASR